MWVKRSGYLLIIIWITLLSLLFRIYYVSFGSIKNKVEKTAGSRFAEFVLYNSKGVVYDRNLSPLLGNQFVYYLVVVPRSFRSADLDYLCDISNSDKKIISTKLKRELPFVLECYNKPREMEGVFVYEGTGRYPLDSVSMHILGYLDSENIKGLAGVEKSYDELLSGFDNTVRYRYESNAVRGVSSGSGITFLPSKDSLDGILLSIDKPLNVFVESVMDRYIKNGCAIVMDCNNGEILSMSSYPEYDYNKISSYSNSDNGELINNCMINQTVGSVFKIVVAACAFENGMENYEFDCCGAVHISDRVFTCQNVMEHGKQNIYKAFANSCNCYFITIGQLLGFDKLIETAQALGLDSSIRIAKDIYSDSGVFPTLSGSLSVANLSIGQGELMLSPLSVCRLTAAVCNGGYLVNPRIYLGTYFDGTYSNEPEYKYKVKALSDKTFKALKKMCITTVESGTGSGAKPSVGGAGGKTASAQTGRVSGNNKEILNTYFTGFYPADDPKYAITVFCIDGESGSTTCAPVFKEICDFISQNY